MTTLRHASWLLPLQSSRSSTHYQTHPPASISQGQLLQSGTSPGANYEEARGAESTRDFVHKLGITLKELQESRYWLRVISGAGLVSNGMLKDVLPEIDELCRIIGSSKRTATASRRAREG